MKVTNNTIRRRNQDFYQVYINTISRFPHIATDDAITIAIHSPAQEYYISEDYAIRYCYALSRRKPISLKRGSAKHLCVMTLFYSARNMARQQNISLRQAIIDVIYSTAPRFYINRSTAYAIIQQHNR